MKPYKKISLSLFSGLLLSIAGPDYLSGFFTFIAFVPLLFLEDYFYKNSKKYISFNFFIYSWLSFAFWNLLSMWWAWQPSIYGLVSPLVLNSLLSALIFWAFHIIRLKSGNQLGYLTFVIFYLAFEYLHFNWALAFPWLVLGNSFGRDILFIQWYEFTGVLGGSLWILVVNYFIFMIIKNIFEKQKITKYIIISATLIIIPIIISVIIFYNYSEIKNPQKILIVQPNIDPYTEKFSKLSVEEQLEKMFKLAESSIKEDVDYCIFPETAISEFVIEDNLKKNYKLKVISDFTEKYPKTKVIIGAMTFIQFSENENIPNSAIREEGSDFYIDYYNSALQFDTSEIVQVYHKSQLLMGAEKMPYTGFFKFMKKMKIEIAGGVTWYGTQPEATVFQSNNDTIKTAAIICWESVFGKYNSDFVSKGADLLFVITNDGWWGNTNGHRKHLRISQIRAIETRRSIARCANTGISAFINQKGEIISQSNYWETKTLICEINANQILTFYTKYGDLIGKISAFLSAFVLIYLFFIKLKSFFM